MVRTKTVANSVQLDDRGIIRITYKGPQTRTTLTTLTEEVYGLLARQRAAGKHVYVMADMRQVTRTDSSARLEAKSFLEEADYDALAIVGNRYLQPLVFFVLRDYKRNRAVKYFTSETSANRWLTHPHPSNTNRLKPHNTLRWVIIPLLLIALAGTAVSWQLAKDRVAAEAEKQFTAETLKTSDALIRRLQSYTDALLGFRGLFHSSDSVSEREYDDYFASLYLAEHYPGFNSINYIQSIPDQETEHFTVTYVGVDGVGSGKGVDLATSNERRATLVSARDNGQTAATDTIQLFNGQGQEQSNTRGFLMTIPIYKNSVPATIAERRLEHEGFVNAVFDYQKLFEQTFGTLPEGVGIRIKQANGELIYQQGDNSTVAHTARLSIQVANRTWVLEVYASPLFGISRSEAAMPAYTAALGIALTAFLAVAFWLQNRARQQAIDLASAMTEDIKQERNLAIAIKNKDEAILSSIGDGVFVLTNDGTIALLNKAAEDMCGFTAKEAIGKPYKEILSFFNEQNGKPAYRFIATALAGKRSEMARRTMLRRKDGSVLPVADSAAPVRDAEGAIQGAVVVFRDITRERQLEHMKDEFLSTASHELRTPMGAIRANISMILSGDYGPVNKGLVEPLTDMKASTVRLVTLVNDLLNVARIEAGRMKFTLTDSNITDILQSTISSLAPLGKEKGVIITFTPGSSALVRADTDKIKQVLTNLVGNSLKFTSKGFIRVTAKAQKEVVEVTVQDTGIGIAPEDQKKLFGRFRQIASAQDGKPAGTGLGLYISREMLRKMGGDLWIEHSIPGEGSTFIFTIPRSDTSRAKKAAHLLEREAKEHSDQK